MPLHRPAGEASPGLANLALPARCFIVLQRVRAIAQVPQGAVYAHILVDRVDRVDGTYRNVRRYDSDAIKAVTYVSNHDVLPLCRPPWAISSIFLPE